MNAWEHDYLAHGWQWLGIVADGYTPISVPQHPHVRFDTQLLFYNPTNQTSTKKTELEVELRFIWRSRALKLQALQVSLAILHKYYGQTSRLDRMGYSRYHCWYL